MRNSRRLTFAEAKGHASKTTGSYAGPDQYSTVSRQERMIPRPALLVCDRGRSGLLLAAALRIAMSLRSQPRPEKSID
jgi:hypothetical protein